MRPIRFVVDPKRYFSIDTDAFLDRELDLSSPYIDSSLPEGTTVRQLLKESSSHSIRTVQASDASISPTAVANNSNADRG